MPQPTGPFLDKHRAADFSHLSVRTLDYARRRGELPYLKVGKKVLFSQADLEQYLMRFRVSVETIP